MTELIMALCAGCPALAAILAIVVVALKIFKNNKSLQEAVATAISNLKDEEIKQLNIDKDELIKLNTALINQIQAERVLLKEMMFKMDHIDRG